jgi:hypothetical protein
MMGRRAFITAAATLPIAGVAVADTRTVAEKVQDHVDEIRRLLKETTPEGVKLHRACFMTEDGLVGAAYPPNWKHGQPHFEFKSHAGGWKAA